MLTMYQQITIKTLKKQGKTNIDIAHELDCHRNTVSNICRRSVIIDKQKRDKPSYFDAFRETIKGYLDKGISRLRIFEILTSEHKVSRTYDSLCKYIQENSNELGIKKTAYVVQQTGSPGEEAEVDFGYLGLIPENEGKLCKAYVFIMKLCFSRESFYAVTYDFIYQRIYPIVCLLWRSSTAHQS
jgi:transcriptional regulator